MNLVGRKCHRRTQSAPANPRLLGVCLRRPLLRTLSLPGQEARRLGRSAGEGQGMAADRHAAMTEIHSELQLVALSFSGAPAN